MSDSGQYHCAICGEPYTNYAGPGPIERKWFSRLHFWLFKSWPRSVVNERLDYADWAHMDLGTHLIQRHARNVPEATSSSHNPRSPFGV